MLSLLIWLLVSALALSLLLWVVRAAPEPPFDPTVKAMVRWILIAVAVIWAVYLLLSFLPGGPFTGAGGPGPGPSWRSWWR